MKREKIKVNTPYYTHHPGAGYEVRTRPSKTVPDQTMSIAEIFQRYAQGLPIGGIREGIYMDDDADPEEELPELRGQKIDQMEQYMEIKEAHDELQERIKKYPKKTVPPGQGAEGVEKIKEDVKTS